MESDYSNPIWFRCPTCKHTVVKINALVTPWCQEQDHAGAAILMEVTRPEDDPDFRIWHAELQERTDIAISALEAMQLRVLANLNEHDFEAGQVKRLVEDRRKFRGGNWKDYHRMDIGIPMNMNAVIDDILEHRARDL